MLLDVVHVQKLVVHTLGQFKGRPAWEVGLVKLQQHVPHVLCPRFGVVNVVVEADEFVVLFAKLVQVPAHVGGIVTDHLEGHLGLGHELVPVIAVKFNEPVKELKKNHLALLVFQFLLDAVTHALDQFVAAGIDLCVDHKRAAIKKLIS